MAIEAQKYYKNKGKVVILRLNRSPSEYFQIFLHQLSLVLESVQKE